MGREKGKRETLERDGTSCMHLRLQDHTTRQGNLLEGQAERKKGGGGVRKHPAFFKSNLGATSYLHLFIWGRLPCMWHKVCKARSGRCVIVQVIQWSHERAEGLASRCHANGVGAPGLHAAAKNQNKTSRTERRCLATSCELPPVEHVGQAQ
jgi:hypothetical protein